MAEVDLAQLAIDRETTRGGSGLRSRRHLLSRYIIPAMLIAGFVALVAWASRDTFFPPLDVEVIPVLATQDSVRAAGGTPLFNAAGWIEPRPTAIRVPGLAAGVIETLLVVEDQWVKAGTPIAELVKDDAVLRLQMATAEEELRRAEVNIANSALVAAKTRHAQPVHLEAELAEADAALANLNTALANLPFELQRAESRLKYAVNDHRRNVNASNSVSRREVEEAKTQVDTMRAMVEELKLRESSLVNEAKAITIRRDALKEQLDLLVDEIQARDQAKAEVAAAKAKLQLSKVNVAEAQLNLERMTIRAPVDGRILLLVGQPGTRIGGQRNDMNLAFDGSTVVTMYRPEMLQVKVDVRFEDVPQVSLGQSVRINNPALRQPVTGSVLFVSSEADIQKNTLEVKVAIESAPDVFKPEMLVDVTFLSPEPVDQGEKETQNLQWRLFVPENLVAQHDGSPIVWIADRSEGVARRTSVALGTNAGDGLVEITGGLDISSRIITSHNANLKDGMRIRITEEQ